MLNSNFYPFLPNFEPIPCKMVFFDLALEQVNSILYSLSINYLTNPNRSTQMRWGFQFVKRNKIYKNLATFSDQLLYESFKEINLACYFAVVKPRSINAQQLQTQIGPLYKLVFYLPTVMYL